MISAALLIFVFLTPAPPIFNGLIIKGTLMRMLWAAIDSLCRITVQVTRSPYLDSLEAPIRLGHSLVCSQKLDSSRATILRIYHLHTKCLQTRVKAMNLRPLVSSKRSADLSKLNL